MNLKDTVYSLLSIKAQEANSVFLLLGMGFFMGLFLATLDVGAASLFLTNFDEKEDLPLAILISGILGIVITAIYNFFQSRISFSALAIWSIILVALVLVGIEIAFRTLEDPLPIYFFSFTFIVPANFIALLVFWGAFGRMFDLRQSKRIIGSIDTGQLVASIIALFSIPILLNTISTQQLLFVSLWSMVGYLGMLIIILRKKLFIQGIERQGTKTLSYVDLFRNKYIVLMAAFITISMIAIKFVDYSFLNVTTQQFSEKDLPNFLSYFEATVVIFSFLFQTFVTDRIIALYGLRVSLLINPVLIALFTALAIPIGYVFGYTAVSENFIFFFIIISMSKLFTASLKDALDGPAFKLYFLPIDSDVKFDVQTKIEGVITAFASLAAGGLIILINNVQVFALIHISIFTLPAILFWYFTTSKMHNNYRHTLQDTLRKNKSDTVKSAQQEYAINKVLENEVNSEQDQKVLLSLQLMEKIEPALFEETVSRLSNTQSERIKQYIAEKARLLEHLNYKGGNDVKKLAQQAKNDSEDAEIISISPKKLQVLSKSIKTEDRILVAKLLRKVTNDENIFILLELLRDIDPRVKLEAILTARKVKRRETWNILIELLNTPTYSNAAACALIEAGEDCLFTLESSFHKSGQDDNTMYKIVKIMGRIGGEKVLELLWNKIEFPDRRILRQILLSFRYCDYRAKPREISQFTVLLENEIGKSIWNLAALIELPNSQHFQFLRNALKEEIADNTDNIFILLSILYDPQSVQLVRENIETGSSEGIAFAIELLDLFIAQDFKPLLFPLFDDISVGEKIRQLQYHFPRERYNEIQLLNYLLNRNYNQTNRWTKACALHAIAFMPDFRISRGLVAQLFNADYLLQEAAAWVIYHKDPDAFHKVSERLNPKVYAKLESSIEKNQLEEGLKDGFFLKIEVIMYLRTIPLFNNIKGLILCDLADKIDTIVLQNNDRLKIDNAINEEHLYIVADGEVFVKDDNHQDLYRLKEQDVYGSLTNYTSDASYLQALERSVVFTLSINDFYTIMSDHHELAQKLINNLIIQETATAF